MDEKILKIIRENRPPLYDLRVSINKLLFHSIAMGDEQWIHYSIYAGARVTQKEYYEAIHYSKLNVLKILCNNAPISANDMKNMVWNLISIQNKKHAKFVHVIVSTIYKESDRILKDIEETIALYAARFNIKKIIQCIIKYTGGLYLCIYRKPVLSACRSGNIEILKMLSEQGSDLHFNDCEPFREAIKNGHIDIARYLLSLGSDVHAHNDYAYRIAAKKKDKNLQDFLKTIL